MWTNYPFCQAWDPQGWFWKPGQAAKKEGYLKVISGAIRDRSLEKSPFPGKEDALCRECYRRAGERYHPEFWQNVSDYLAYRKAQP